MYTSKTNFSLDKLWPQEYSVIINLDFKFNNIIVNHNMVF